MKTEKQIRIYVDHDMLMLMDSSYSHTEFKINSFIIYCLHSEKFFIVI